MKWEYKIDTNCLYFKPELDRLGSQGWELVSVFLSQRNLDGSMIYYFKRPIPEPSIPPPIKD